VQESDFFNGLPANLKSDLEKKISETHSELKFIEGKLNLCLEGQCHYCDFLSPKFLQEVRQNYSRSDNVYSFLKALSKNNKDLKILDLTAGLGRDLFKFVLAGHKVMAFEKDPIVFVLLKDGLRRFLDSSKLSNIKASFHLERDFRCEIFYGDSLEFIKNTEEQFDLIYFDPMFEDKRKKAAPKKHMQMIKKIVDASKTEKETVIEAALKKTQACVLKSSEFLSSKLKPKRVLSFKGYNYYIF